MNKNTQKIRLSGYGCFSAEQSLLCGQCFQWEKQEDGSFLGVHRGSPARIFSDETGILISGEGGEAFWKDYFDLELDYGKIKNDFASDALSREACTYSGGIRILKQEPWEALCAFLISQCNNIPRITSILHTLRKQFGQPVQFEGRTLYAFPGPERLANLETEDLKPLRAGYRAPYLLAAARAVCAGNLCFEALRGMETEKARETVQQLPGVGRKVADCFLLYGMHDLSCWPEDTWMKKVASVYPRAEKLKKDKYAGIIQQYLFYFVRAHWEDGTVQRLAEMDRIG